MPCCGDARRQLGPVAKPKSATEQSAIMRRFAVEFEYTGATALTVVGSVSGRRYRFNDPGARVVIDPRDRPSLARVPRLREVTTSTR
jgi:hypothetical protein